MTLTAIRLAASLTLLAALASACSTATPGVGEEAVFQTADGVAIVDTFTAVATITSVDATSRKVTLTDADGKSSSYKAASGVDVSQFRVGEQVAVQVMDETLLEIKRGVAPASDSIATSFAAAADEDGDTAMFEGETVEASAKIAAVDIKARTVTLQLADGTTKTLKAQGNVDLNQAAVGTTVVVKYAVAVLVATAND
jgi:hypothetical protein